MNTNNTRLFLRRGLALAAVVLCVCGCERAAAPTAVAPGAAVTVGTAATSERKNLSVVRVAPRIQKLDERSVHGRQLFVVEGIIEVSAESDPVKHIVVSLIKERPTKGRLVSDQAVVVPEHGPDGVYRFTTKLQAPLEPGEFDLEFKSAGAVFHKEPVSF